MTWLEVRSVVDASRHIKIEVTSSDNQSSEVKKHTACALAVACRRALKLDGAVVSRAMAYLVRGSEATRYRLPNAVSREIAAFDRGASFEPGLYQLRKPEPSGRMGADRRKNRDKNRSHGKGRKPINFRHITTNVRTALTS